MPNTFETGNLCNFPCVLKDKLRAVIPVEIAVECAEILAKERQCFAVYEAHSEANSKKLHEEIRARAESDPTPEHLGELERAGTVRNFCARRGDVAREFYGQITGMKSAPSYRALMVRLGDLTATVMRDAADQIELAVGELATKWQITLGRPPEILDLVRTSYDHRAKCESALHFGFNEWQQFTGLDLAEIAGLTRASRKRVKAPPASSDPVEVSAPPATAEAPAPADELALAAV